jgi:hypothetical protein
VAIQIRKWPIGVIEGELNNGHPKNGMQKKELTEYFPRG